MCSLETRPVGSSTHRKRVIKLKQKKGGSEYSEPPFFCFKSDSLSAPKQHPEHEADCGGDQDRLPRFLPSIFFRILNNFLRVLVLKLFELIARPRELLPCVCPGSASGVLNLLSVILC